MYNRGCVCVPALTATNIRQMSPWYLQLNQPRYPELLCRKKAGVRFGRYIFQANITTTTGKQPFRKNRKRDGNYSQPSSRDAMDRIILSARGPEKRLFDIIRL